MNRYSLLCDVRAQAGQDVPSESRQSALYEVSEPEEGELHTEGRCSAEYQSLNALIWKGQLVWGIESKHIKDNREGTDKESGGICA